MELWPSDLGGARLLPPKLRLLLPKRGLPHSQRGLLAAELALVAPELTHLPRRRVCHHPAEPSLLLPELALLAAERALLFAKRTLLAAKLPLRRHDRFRAAKVGCIADHVGRAAIANVKQRKSARAIALGTMVIVH